MHTHNLNTIQFFSPIFCLLWTKWKRSKLFVQIRFPPCLAAKSPSKALIRQDVHCGILQHHCSTFWHQTPFAFTNKGFQTRPTLWELLLVWSGLVNDNHHNFQVDIAICPYIGKIYMKHPNIAFSVAKMLRTGREQDYQTNHFATTAIATLLHHFLVVCWSLVGWSVTDNSLAANCPYFPYTSFFGESSYFSCSIFIRTQNSGKRKSRVQGRWNRHIRGVGHAVWCNRASLFYKSVSKAAADCMIPGARYRKVLYRSKFEVIFKGAGPGR